MKAKNPFWKHDKKQTILKIIKPTLTCVGVFFLTESYHIDVSLMRCHRATPEITLGKEMAFINLHMKESVH